MKNIVKFILFITYTISVFFVKDIKILLLLYIFNLIIAKISKVTVLGIFNNFKIVFPFILFTVLLNMIFGSISFGILIGARIIICFNITYIFSKTISIFEISQVIENLLFPLKLFRVNTKNIGIIVSIAMCMIPVFKNEISSLTNAMKSKGKHIKLSNLVILMRPILISILRKTSEIEKSLIAKAYNE